MTRAESIPALPLAGFLVNGLVGARLPKAKKKPAHAPALAVRKGELLLLAFFRGFGGRGRRGRSSVGLGRFGRGGRGRSSVGLGRFRRGRCRGSGRSRRRGGSFLFLAAAHQGKSDQRGDQERFFHAEILSWNEQAKKQALELL